MYINGEWLKTDQQFSVTNPATGDVIEMVPDGDKSHAMLAVDAAYTAFPSWSTETAYRRAEVLQKAYGLMIERKQTLAELMTREQGKPLKAALMKCNTRLISSDGFPKRPNAYTVRLFHQPESISAL